MMSGFNKKKPVKAAEPKKPVDKAKAEPVMYVGPTVKGLGIQNRVYSRIPDDAAAAIKEDAELGFLFIPVIRYPQAAEMLRNKDGYIYRAFEKALSMKK